jgi:hypothetical protein
LRLARRGYCRPCGWGFCCRLETAIRCLSLKLQLIELDYDICSNICVWFAEGLVSRFRVLFPLSRLAATSSYSEPNSPAYGEFCGRHQRCLSLHACWVHQRVLC